MPIPQEILSLLQSARYLHLGTSSNDKPHVSLMNYTFLPQGQDIKEACVIMTSDKDTHKVCNITKNPNVSLLVHDWTAAKTPQLSESHGLSKVLQDMNQTELSRKSITLDGLAKIVNDDEAEFYRKKLQECTPQKEHKFIDEDTVVILVTLTGAVVADVDNQVRVYDTFS